MTTTPERSRSRRVALLAEGVDRNNEKNGEFTEAKEVALLAEGVDRNRRDGKPDAEKHKSPSSRRAWIEIRYKSTTKS